MADAFDLDRFVEAQARVYSRALDELRRGRKESHWMWFVFPQIRGLGMSAMAERYAIASLAEARAYLGHPLLGTRLRECVDAVMEHKGRPADAIFGCLDTLKFRSSLTLFAEAAPADRRFRDAIDGFFGGEADTRTLEILGRSAG